MVRILTRKFVPNSTSSDEYDFGTLFLHSSSWPITETPEVTDDCTIEYFFAAKDPFRRGTSNRMPIPWPFDTDRPLRVSISIMKDIRDRAKQLLEENQITFGSMRVAGLGPRYTSMEKTQTVIITTPDVNFECWTAAADAIQEIVNNSFEILSLVDFELAVEIRNEEMMHQDVSAFIGPDGWTSYHTFWEPFRLPRFDAGHQVSPMNIENVAFLQRVDELVMEQLRSDCIFSCISISYHKRWNDCQNSGKHVLVAPKPTVMIGIKPGTKHVWLMIEERIRDHVQQNVVRLGSSFDRLGPSLDEIHIELFPSYKE